MVWGVQAEPSLLLRLSLIHIFLQYPDMFVDLYEAPCNAKEIEDQYVEWKWKRGETVDGRLIACLLYTSRCV